MPSVSLTLCEQVEAVVVLEDVVGAYIDMQAVVASGAAVMPLTPADGGSRVEAKPKAVGAAAHDEPSETGGSNVALIAVGATAGVLGMVAIGLAAWQIMRRRGEKKQELPLDEVVSPGEMAQGASLDKGSVESMLFGCHTQVSLRCAVTCCGLASVM